jgi:hypothetical protein
MTTTGWILLLVFCMIAGALLGWAIVNAKRSKHLRRKFGPEYAHTVHELGGRRKAEAELAAREARVEGLQLRKISNAERDRFLAEWHSVQEAFVDAPATSVQRADKLVRDLMHAIGYPVADFDQRAADISVEHPGVVNTYRAAHAIAVRNERGMANTEDLRTAMIDYRNLFEGLLETESARTDGH